MAERKQSQLAIGAREAWDAGNVYFTAELGAGILSNENRDLQDIAAVGWRVSRWNIQRDSNDNFHKFALFERPSSPTEG